MFSRLRIITAASCGIRDMQARLTGDVLAPLPVAAGLSAPWTPPGASAAGAQACSAGRTIGSCKGNVRSQPTSSDQPT